jgi:hypothetical protein
VIRERRTQSAGWHVGAGAQSSSFSHASVEKIGDATAPACEASGPFPAGGADAFSEVVSADLDGVEGDAQAIRHVDISSAIR